MVRLLVRLLAAALLLALAAPAQAQSRPEVLTIVVDLTGPRGSVLLGTFVVQRQAGAAQESWSFNGTLDGRRVTASGAATERWDSRGVGTIELTSLSSSVIALDALPVRTLTISSGTGGVVTVSGLPLAVSGPVNPPGKGSASILVTNAGQGPRVVAALPNTAGAPGVSPEAIASVLVALGMAMLAAGLLWLRAGRLSARRAEAQVGR